MCRGLLIAVLAVLLAADPGWAGSRPRILMQQRMPQGQMKAPRLPPSAAVNGVRRSNPGSTVLGIRNMGNGYSVTFRKGNQVKRVIIPDQ